MCGVAATTETPSATNRRAISSETVNIGCPVVDAGEDVAMKVDHVFERPTCVAGHPRPVTWSD